VSNLTAGVNKTPSQDKKPVIVSKPFNACIVAILCAALLSPFGALPAFDIGYFNLVAASIMWLHFCAGIGALLIVFGSIVAPDTVLPRALNPVTLGLVFFAILSAFNVVSADFPKLVVLGSPQSGKGALWFIDAAVFVALGSLIRGSRQSTLIVCCTAVALTALISGVLTYARLEDTALLLRGGDSYAYLGLTLPFLSLLVPDAQHRRRYALLFSVVAAVCIIVAENKAAAIVFVTLGAVFLVLDKAPRAAAFISRLRFRSVYVLVLVVSATLSYGLVSYEFRGAFDSIDSRLLIADITVAAQIDSTPAEWLIGHGWGHTQSGLYRNLTESGANLLSNQWDFLWRDIFHSHNLVLELIYETGLVGYLAFCALLAALITQTRPAHRLAATVFVLGYLLISSVWFEFAHSVPYFSLTILALFVEVRVDRKVLEQRAIGLAVFSSIMLICLVASAVLYDFAQHIKPFKPSRGALAGASYPIKSLPNDPRGSDFLRAAVFRDVLRNIKQASQKGAVDPASVITGILNDIESRLSNTSSPELLLVGLAIFNDANYHDKQVWMKPIVEGRETLWDQLAIKHMDLAPKRTDVLVVYLSWLTANHRTQRVQELVGKILQSHSNEPVGLYFQGVIDTQNPSQTIKRRGLRTIGQAVSNGVERFVEVPKWLKELAAKTKAP
jgi:hypothetical protein